MKRLALIFALLASQANATTVAYYDFESGALLTNSTGGEALTEVGDIQSVASAACTGSSSAQATTPSLTTNNGFTAPASVLSSTGTAQFSIEVSSDRTSNQHIFYLNGTAGERRVTCYLISGSLNFFVNGIAGTAITHVVAVDTEYIVKMTWNGSSFDAWVGEKSDPCMATLTDVGSLAAPTWGGDGEPTIAYGMHYSPSAVASFIGKIDGLLLTDTYDDTGTVLAYSDGVSQLSPYMNPYQERFPFVFPAASWRD